MIEFLPQMEMTQQIEMLQETHHLEDSGEPKKTTSDKTAPAKKEGDV